MNNKSFNKLSDKLVKAFLKNKIIPLPKNITKKFEVSNKFRKLCESKEINQL